MSELQPNVKDGGGGAVVSPVGPTSALVPPSDSVVIAITSIHATAAVFSASDADDFSADLTNIVGLADGTTIFGRWTTFTLSAGQVIAYFG